MEGCSNPNSPFCYRFHDRPVTTSTPAPGRYQARCPGSRIIWARLSHSRRKNSPPKVPVRSSDVFLIIGFSSDYGSWCRRRSVRGTHEAKDWQVHRPVRISLANPYLPPAGGRIQNFRLFLWTSPLGFHASLSDARAKDAWDEDKRNSYACLSDAAETTSRRDQIHKRPFKSTNDLNSPLSFAGDLLPYSQLGRGCHYQPSW
jgi:hypothetical protein